MENLTFEEKIELLCTVFGEGAKFATVTMQNTVESTFYGTNGHNKTLAKKPPFSPKKLLKTGIYHMNVNFIYENSVNYQQRHEGNDAPNFESLGSNYNHSKKWLATKEGKETVYFYAKMESVKYEDVLFSVELGRNLTSEEMAQMLPYKKPIVSKETAQQNQGVEKVIEPRYFKFENIRKIKCGIEVEF
jgi:hypothetical protein